MYGPGTDRSELSALSAAILGLARPSGPPPGDQAARLAITSPYSPRAWQDAIDVIDGAAGLIPGADPAVLLDAVTRLTGLGYHPAASAHHLIAACLQLAPPPPTRRQRLAALLAAPWRTARRWAAR
jgi:hypothetical protein